jgi:hypothetical protein
MTAELKQAHAQELEKCCSELRLASARELKDAISEVTSEAKASHEKRLKGAIEEQGDDHRRQLKRKVAELESAHTEEMQAVAAKMKAAHAAALEQAVAEATSRKQVELGAAHNADLTALKDQTARAASEGKQAVAELKVAQARELERVSTKLKEDHAAELHGAKKELKDAQAVFLDKRVSELQIKAQHETEATISEQKATYEAQLGKAESKIQAEAVAFAKLEHEVRALREENAKFEALRGQMSSADGRRAGRTMHRCMYRMRNLKLVQVWHRWRELVLVDQPYTGHDDAMETAYARDIMDLQQRLRHKQEQCDQLERGAQHALSECQVRTWIGLCRLSRANTCSLFSPSPRPRVVTNSICETSSMNRTHNQASGWTASIVFVQGSLMASTPSRPAAKNVNQHRQ